MPNELEARCVQALVEGRLLTREEPLVVAVSGGIDSMALLTVLSRLREREGWPTALHVAHMNHGLRDGDSDADAEFVAEQARNLKVPCTVEAADVRARAASEGISVELAGRQCRYEFFERLCLKLNCHAIAVAHHADDNVETILQRIIRGTGIRGLSGIGPTRPIRDGSPIRLIRPMLGLRRSQIEHFAQANGIPFHHDATNDSSLYARNRIRNELLDILRTYNPQVDEAVLRLGEQARGLEAYLRETGSRVLESLVVDRDDRQLVLHGPSLARKPRVIQVQLLREAILRMGVGEGEMSAFHLNALVELAAGQEGTKELHLPGGLKVTRRYSRLVFDRDIGDQLPPVDNVDIHVDGEGLTQLRRFRLELSLEVLEADSRMIESHIRQRTSGGCSYEEWLDADEVHPPLVARSRRPGDRFWPLGNPGMKKLSDFLIDEKVEADQRDQVVVLCDQLGPIWVVPQRIDERVRLTRMTRRILRICARPVPSEG